MQTNDQARADGEREDEREAALREHPGWRRRHRRYGYGPEFVIADVAQLPDWLL